MAETDKQKALSAALSQIEKQFGKGSIMRMNETQVNDNLQVISTGSLGLDMALGVGGLPRGRVVEIYGPESSGKTTLCLQVVAEAQKLGGTCAYIELKTRWIRCMPASSASRWTTCWFRSRIPASRHWKSATCWCARAGWT